MNELYDTEGFIKSFDPTQSDDSLLFFQKYGFVVIHNVLSGLI